MERPATPWAPPSWSPPQVQRLLEQLNVEKRLIHQCAFGAENRKPTELLCIHMLALGAALDARVSGVLCSHPRGHNVPEGEDSQGHWRTAAAKTYPEGLCK
eukprot:7333414-Pyramimonas_sp.AAC.1